jgi:hypothetical protein
MNVYYCSKCYFYFERVSVVKTCPSCEEESVRYATDTETAEYKRRQDFKSAKYLNKETNCAHSRSAN